MLGRRARPCRIRSPAFGRSRFMLFANRRCISRCIITLSWIGLAGEGRSMTQSDFSVGRTAAAAMDFTSNRRAPSPSSIAAVDCRNIVKTFGAGMVRALDGLPPYRRPVNTVFQSYAVFPHLTVAENVAFGLEMQRQPRADIATRVRDMLALVK